MLERGGLRAEEPWRCGSTSHDPVRYLAHALSVKGEGFYSGNYQSHVLHKPERGSSDEKTGTDFRTEASGLRQDKCDVPKPPSSAVRWEVIRMGIVSRPRKAQATVFLLLLVIP